MLKRILVLFLIQSLPAFALADWMEDLVKDIEEQGLVINNRADLMRFLGEEKVDKKSESEPLTERQKDLLSTQQYARDLVSIVQSENGKKVQVNFFQNAYFYGQSPKVVRFPASTSKATIEAPSKHNLNFKSNFFFSSIDATDVENGGSIRSLSKLNMGIDLTYSRTIRKQMLMTVGLGGNFLGFEPAAGEDLDGQSNIYFSLASGMVWDIDSYFNIVGKLGFKQLPYLTAFGDQLTVASATHPFFGAGLQVKLVKLIRIDLRPELSIDVLNNSIQGNVDAESGVMMGTKLGYHFSYKTYQPLIAVWYNQYSQNTQVTNQTMNEIGIWAGFQLPL